MDVFRERCTFKPNELKSLNQCRLFLQVTVVSDICDASGRAISKDYFDGVLSTIQSRDSAAVQERPVALKTWNLWKRALTILVHNRKDRILRQPWSLAASALLLETAMASLVQCRKLPKSHQSLPLRVQDCIYCLSAVP
jgi:hypothetical protein